MGSRYSAKDVRIPDLITQVTRNDDEENETLYSGGISARRENGEEDITDEESYYYKKPSLCARIFCCCFSRSDPSSSELALQNSTINALLPAQSPEKQGRICLVLDLDETLVHSSFQPLNSPDIMVKVEIENVTHNVYVSKRPGVDNFMQVMGEHFEVIVFTASISKYADPVLDKLDIHRVIDGRLFRESCTFTKGNYVKDLARLGRPLQKTLIIDNSPNSYIFHPEYAIPIESWFDDPNDTALTDMIPFLVYLASVDDVREPIHKWNAGHRNIAEFAQEHDNDL